MERADRILETYTARVVLSFLILLSILPLEDVIDSFQISGLRAPSTEVMDLAFFCIFAPEFVIRAAVYARRRRKGRAGAGEMALLALDLVATLSFLPLTTLFKLQGLRLVRLVRMVLLVGYWGSMVTDLWGIVTARERRFQVFFVVALGAILSLTGAVLIHELHQTEGVPDAPFLDTLWWCFRQVSDPGNLIQQPNELLMVAVSLLLTFAGLLLFSFLIGIGTGAIDELMQKSRLRPVGMRDHTVVLGAGEATHFLLEQFAELYDKNERVVKAAVLGPWELPPNSMRGTSLTRFAYRRGDPVQVEDLTRMNVRRAKRVVILGSDLQDPDAEVISTILATRDRNPTVDVYAVLDHERNLIPARTAGGPHTHVIGSGSFLGHYIAQNVLYPGAYRLYRQLLTSEGCEIYTYIFDDDERDRLLERAGDDGVIDPTVLYARAFREFGVTLLGFFVHPDLDAEVEADDLAAVLHPGEPSGEEWAFTENGALKVSCLRGIVGISLRWRAVRQLAAQIVEESCTGERPTAPEGFDDLTLRLPVALPRQVLICGGSERVPRVVTELVKFCRRIRITALVLRPIRVQPLTNEIVTALESAFPATEDADPVTVRQEEDVRVIEVRPQGAGSDSGPAEIRVQHANWTDATRLVRHPVVDLTKTDAILFLPTAGVSDKTDGLVALDCLQLAHFEESGEVRFPEHLRVIGTLEDPVKGDLLERQLDRRARHRPETTFTIVSGERIRHHFVMQNIFVRGLNAVSMELLDSTALSLCRVVPRTRSGDRPSGAVNLWDYARHLLVDRGLVLVGIERLDEAGHREVLLDPDKLNQGPPVPWDRIPAVYVLGDGRRLVHAADGPE